MITIVLADDHQVVRQALRSLLETEPDFRIVGEAGDGLQALKLIEEKEPDALVLDLMMPGLNGLEVTRQIVKRARQTRVVILTMYADEAYVLEAFKNGATAYVLKASSATDLVQAIREAVAGRRYLSPPLSDRAIAAYEEKSKAMPLDKYETLTPRERQILQLAAEGHTHAQIAARLGVSRRTAETHRTNLMRKLGLHAQADLIRYALRRGIISIEG